MIEIEARFCGLFRAIIEMYRRSRGQQVWPLCDCECSSVWVCMFVCGPWRSRSFPKVEPRSIFLSLFHFYFYYHSLFSIQWVALSLNWSEEIYANGNVKFVDDSPVSDSLSLSLSLSIYLSVVIPAFFQCQKTNKCQNEITRTLLQGRRAEMRPTPPSMIKSKPKIKY